MLQTMSRITKLGTESGAEPIPTLTTLQQICSPLS